MVWGKLSALSGLSFFCLESVYTCIELVVQITNIENGIDKSVAERWDWKWSSTYS
jgi:hypothetical protein